MNLNSDEMPDLNRDYHRAPIDRHIRYEECVGTCLLAEDSLTRSSLLCFFLSANKNFQFGHTAENQRSES